MPALADGEQKFHEQGTKWVDPVEYYNLQDINRTDFQRSYDQGDIDFNKEIARKGKKVYGLRLKPFAGAVWAETIFKAVDKEVTSSSIEYQSLYGVKGIPLHEAGFCIYADEGVSRSYDFPYKYKLYYEKRTRTYTDNYTGKANISITGLHLSPTANGVGLSYAFSSNASEECYSNGRRKGKMKIKFNKQAGVDNKYGKFIYFSGGRDLIVMLSGKPELKRSPTIDLLNRPFARVYFIVEQILVEDDEEPVVPLTAEDKQELTNYVGDLITWLRGEGDPLGLGEHTDAKTSAVINSIATVAAILSGGVIGGFIGGSGAQIAANMTDTIINATGGDFPPPDYPNQPETEGTEPKRDDEDDKPQPSDGNGADGGNPPTDDGKGNFNSGPYADLFNKYVVPDADGDITLKDPITGQETIYINNGDGTYKNLTTGQDWTPDEIGERLDYKVENSDTLSQDAATAKDYYQKNKANWDSKLARGYSDEAKEYHDYLAAQEEQNRREEMLEKLFDKYHVYDGDVGHLKEVMLDQRDENMKTAALFLDKANTYDKVVTVLEVTDKVCDTTLYTMGKCVPGGAYVYDGYALIKGVGVATSEVIYDPDNKGLGLSHIGRGALKGGMAIVQNHAADISKYATGLDKGAAFLGGEYVAFVAPEGVTGALKAIEQGKDWRQGMADGMATKTMAYGTNKLLGGLTGAAKEDGKLGFIGKKRDTMFGMKVKIAEGDKASVIHHKIMAVNDAVTKRIGTKIPSVLAQGNNYSLGKMGSVATTKTIGYLGGYNKSLEGLKQIAGISDKTNDMAADAANFKK